MSEMNTQATKVFTELTPKPIQSISCSVRGTMQCTITFCSRQAANRILLNISQAICLSGVILSLILCLTVFET